jgi:hypothetical protein
MTFKSFYCLFIFALGARDHQEKMLPQKEPATDIG